MRNKIITAITTICMVVGLLIPMITSNETEVHAQTTPTTKSIMFGLKGLQGGQASNVYMGKFPQSEITDISKLKEHVDYEKLKYALNGIEADHYFAIEPIKWRVLDSTNGLLLSDMSLDSSRFDNDSNVWADSELKSWLNDTTTGHDDATGATGFKGYAFSAEEQETLKKQETLNLGDIFLLDTNEAGKPTYFANNAARIATNSGYASKGDRLLRWWLRSPGLDTDRVVIVDDYGNVFFPFGDYINNLPYGVRPALNLNPDSVLFTSAAEGGKSTSTGGAEMSPISGYTGNDWKVTVKDTARNTFIASTKSGTTILPTGGNVNIEWENAKIGNGEYISYMITDSSNTEALYYGSIQSNSINNSQNIKIPANLAAGNYKLRVFNEQKNGNKYTDYASDFSDVGFTVLAKPTVTSLATNPTPASLDGEIKMTFSEEMDTTTAGSVKLGAETLSGGTWSNSNKTYTVSYAGLLNSKEYTVNVSGFESTAGLTMDDSTHTFTTVAAKPKVTSLTTNPDPASLAGEIVMTFSEAMDKTEGSVELGTETLPTGTWSNGDKTYTVSYKGLSNSKEYTVNVSGFKSKLGGVMDDDSSHTFTTVPAKPTVTSLTTNSTPASLAGEIVMTFSEAMDKTEGSVELGTETLSTGTWSNGDKTYTVSYKGLSNSKEYTVNVSGFKSKLGGVMDDDSTHTFTTVAAKPTVTSLTTNPNPASLDGKIVMTFSEAMDKTEGSVELGTETLPTGTWSNGDKTYTVSYKGLSNSKEYTVNVSGFKSKLGGVMDDDSSHTFTTVPAKPIVSSISTDHTPVSLNGTIKMIFSEEMNTTKGSVKLGTKTLNAGTWSNDDKTYTVSYAGLSNSKEYTVNVSGFESTAGVTMDDSTHTFTTVAANTPSSPKTGDSSNTTLYFGLLVISGIFVVGMKRRKELDRKEMSE